jgi:hypothetical protein
MKFSHTLTVAVPAVALLLISTPAPAQTVEQNPELEPKPCVEEVQTNLKKHNIDWEQVKDKAEFYRIEPEEDRQVGVNVWVRPPQCKEGWLVMDMAASCAVRSTWTTEGCSVPGLESY